MTPFDYPSEPHERLHGPAGYKEYESYRDWLRDEFLFRCVYCLRREQWGLLKGQYHIDHFFPKAIYPEWTLDYDNLLYCCSSCNLSKGEQFVPNPESEFTQNAVEVFEDGTIEGRTSEAKKIIRKLYLDSPDYNEYRMNLIGIIELASTHKQDIYYRLMRYPELLPDLASKRPPNNTRSDGIDESCFALRTRHQLPDSYM